MFVDKIAGLNPKQSLSTNIKLNILEDLKDDISFTAVANKKTCFNSNCYRCL